MKQPIKTNLHTYFDYGSAIIIATSPWVFFIDHVPMVIPLSITIGLFIVVMSLLTAYEGGIIRVIPMQIHLFLDVVIGILFAISPWLLGFAHETHIFQLAVGIGIILIASSTTAKSHLETIE